MEVNITACQTEPKRIPFVAGVLFAIRRMERNVHLNTTVLSPRLRKKTTIPFPWVYEILDGMVASQIIRKVDLKQGYHQIGVHREHVHRTGFWTKSRLYQVNVMPFSLCNEQSAF